MIAVCFHISALIGLPVLVLAIAGVRFISRLWILSLVPIGIVGSVVLKPLWDILENLSRTSDYLNGTRDIEPLRLLSVYLIIHLMILGFVFVAFWKTTSPMNRMIIFCSSFGLFLQLLLSSNAGLALRSSEVFGLFDMALFMIPFSHLKKNSVSIYLLFILILGAIFFASSLKIVQPYQWVLG